MTDWKQIRRTFKRDIFAKYEDTYQYSFHHDSQQLLYASPDDILYYMPPRAVRNFQPSDMDYYLTKVNSGLTIKDYTWFDVDSRTYMVLQYEAIALVFVAKHFEYEKMPIILYYLTNRHDTTAIPWYTYANINEVRPVTSIRELQRNPRWLT